MKDKSKEFKLEIANVIVEMLWVKGLISDDEKKRIKEKNKSIIFQ